MYPTVTGGMEIFNYYFIKSRLGGDFKEDLYYSSERLDDFPGNAIVYRSMWPFRLFYPLQYIWNIFKSRKRFDYSCVSFAEQSVFLTLVQCVLMLFLQKRFYLVIHWGSLPNLRFKFIYRFIFQHSKAVIGVSKEICRMYESHFPGIKFKYIPPLIPFPTNQRMKADLRKQMGIPQSGCIFLFAGTLKTMKNPDTIIDAACILGIDFLEQNKIRFIFAGNGHLMDELVSKVRSQGMESFFQFAGTLKREEMAALYSISDGYIISSDYEGTSLSLLEAMYNGLLILGSNVPGVNEMLSDKQNSLLFEVRNPRSLADKLIFSLNHWDELDGLRNQAKRDYMEKYSYGKMMEDYNSLFFNDNSLN